MMFFCSSSGFSMSTVKLTVKTSHHNSGVFLFSDCYLIVQMKLSNIAYMFGTDGSGEGQAAAAP